MRLPIAVTALAIVAAIAGTALAGPGPVAGPAGKVDKAAKQAKQAKKKAKKALKLANSKEAEPGLSGEKGETGDSGAAGEKGETAPDVTGTFTARINGLAATAGTQFGRVTGPSTASSVENVGATLSPAVDVVVRDLAVVLSAPPGLTNTREFTIRGGGDTLVTCSITGSLETGCNSDALSDTISAGSKISISIETTGAAIGAADALIGFRTTTP